MNRFRYELLLDKKPEKKTDKEFDRSVCSYKNGGLGKVPQNHTYLHNWTKEPSVRQMNVCVSVE